MSNIPEKRLNRRALAILLLLLATLAGLALRFFIAWHAMGTNDAATFENFGYGLIDPKVGLIEMYRKEPEFNHPPLVGLWTGFSLLHAGEEGLKFSRLFKMPMLIGDLLAAFLIYDLWRPRHGRTYAMLAAAAFAWSVDSILVTAFHCNTDSLCAVLVLLSAYFVDRRRMHFLGGLALAAALNVKLIPLVLVAPMLLSYRNWKHAAFFAAGFIIGLIPFVPVIYLAGREFHRNALAYNSNVCLWGINQFLLGWRDGQYTSASSKALAERIIDAYHVYGRYLLMGLPALLGLVNWKYQRWTRCEICAIGLAIFLVLTPGFGVQYTVFVVPVLIAASVGAGFLYSTLAGAFLAITYYHFWDGSPWWYSNFTGPFPQPGPQFGLLGWAVLAFWLSRMITRAVVFPWSPGPAR